MSSWLTCLVFFSKELNKAFGEGKGEVGQGEWSTAQEGSLDNNRVAVNWGSPLAWLQLAWQIVILPGQTPNRIKY